MTPTRRSPGTPAGAPRAATTTATITENSVPPAEPSVSEPRRWSDEDLSFTAGLLYEAGVSRGYDLGYADGYQAGAAAITRQVALSEAGL